MRCYMTLQPPSPFARIGVGALTVLAVILCDVTARVHFDLSSASPTSTTEEMSDLQDAGEDPDGTESEGERFPVDGNVLNAGTLPQGERAARWTFNREAKARTVERFPNGLRHHHPGWRRIDRVVAESDCITHTLAVMAPAIRSHGPPLQLG